MNDRVISAVKTSEMNPKVSVCVVTYNHVHYIEQCLQSLVDQYTDFPFEVIVCDDASTDGTSAIVDRFAKSHPDIMRAVIHSSNIGGAANLLLSHSLARGEYIAHLDGDDYALPGKLQSQADVLDAEPECNLVFHRSILLHRDGNSSEIREPEDLCRTEVRYRAVDLAAFGSIAVHSSEMYRTSCRPIIDQNDLFLDQTLFPLIVKNGYAKFSSVLPLGVYRVGVGVSSNNRRNCQLRVIGGYHLLLNKMPELRSHVCAACIEKLRVDFRNGFVNTPALLKLFHRSFHPLALKQYFRILSFKLKFSRKTRA